MMSHPDNKNGQLKFDLHVHTHYSNCALLKPADIVSVAARKGLGGVAVTDHNTIEGALEVRSLARSLNVIVAEEVRTLQGEISGYFLRETIPPRLSARETIREIRGQGGLVSVPHPFDRLRSSRLQAETLREVADEVDMIEVFNARDILTRTDDGLLQFVLSRGALPIVSSDAHFKTEIGRACMVLDAFTTPAEFLQNLKNARRVATKSPLWVHLATKLIRAYRKNKKGK